MKKLLLGSLAVLIILSITLGLTILADYAKEKKIVFDAREDFYHLYGEVTPQMAQDFRQKISTYEGRELLIYINSPGGEVFSAIDMLQALRSAKTHTVCIAEQAMSAAFWFLMNCDERYILPHGVVLTHRVQLSGIAGDMDTVNDILYFIEQIEIPIMEDMAAKMRMSLEEFKIFARKEKYIAAKTAQEMHIAKIVEDVRCTISLLRETEERKIKSCFGDMFCTEKIYKFSACPLLKLPVGE